MIAVLHKRDVLLRKLMKAMEHLPEDYRYAVLTSWMGLDRLEHLVKFLEGKL